MSQENKIEEYKQKLKAFWNLCREKLAPLQEKAQDYMHKFGEFQREKSEKLDQFLDHYTNKVRRVVKKGTAFLRRHGAVVLQKLDPYLQKLKAALKKAAAFLRRYGKRLLQILALMLLKCREYLQIGLAKLKKWLVPVLAKLPKPQPWEPEELEEYQEELQLSEDSELSEQKAAENKEPKYPDFLPENVKAWLLKADPYIRKTGAVLTLIGGYIGMVIKWIWKLRAFIMSIPVVWAAIKLAMDNMDRLPEQVGLDIQSTGEFARLVSRSDAVYWPLGITLFCVLLTLMSKKPILPWVISIFTLVLPLLIWFTNYYA